MSQITATAWGLIRDWDEREEQEATDQQTEEEK